jgi:hypothetical protein
MFSCAKTCTWAPLEDLWPACPFLQELKENNFVVGMPSMVSQANYQTCSAQGFVQSFCSAVLQLTGIDANSKASSRSHETQNIISNVVALC